MAEVLPIRPHAGGTTNSEPPAPPTTLSAEAAAIWTRIADEWVLGADALPILVLGLEAWDRYRQAADMLREDGPVVVNPQSGAVRQHPAHAVCRDNLTAIRQCFRQLHLEPPEAL